MTDMHRGWLPGCTNTDHNPSTLSLALRICPPPPVTQKLSNPSWKVIVSASRGQCLEPGSSEPGFLFWRKAFSVTCSSSIACQLHPAKPSSSNDRESPHDSA